jgi:Polyketide cyclase / dehydrase and lipid transport
MASYSFVDEWRIAASPEDIYALLSCPREYPEWWGEAFLEGEGDSGPAAPGKRARLLTRGWLPYRLRWELECVEAIVPTRLDSRIRGDFEGRGVWTITKLDDGATRVVLEWDIDVRKRLVRHLTPILRPVFRWNHSWAMRHGERRMRELLEDRAEM